jgi:formylglycine-generating enzyme required for sulfatase activity
MLSQSVINIINKPLPDGAISNLSQIDPKFTRYFTPTIIVSPESTSLIQGSNGSLSVEADGQFLSYQWFKNGEAIPNITSSSLVLENAKFETDDANYSVVVTNDWGAVESALVKVQVLTSLPLISLLGDDPYQLEAALTFVDPGASAQDALGNDLSYKILVEGADFNTSNLGSYQVLYTVTDDGGNTSTKERTVTVDDTLSPELQLLGDANITQLLDTPWVDPGVEAQDERDGNITADIVVSGSVDVNTTGTYTLTYTVSDAAGNEANATRIVRVVDHLLELNSTVSLEMIWVEAGTFTMGQVGVAEPEHEVTLTNGFYLGKYEVTQAQYEAVMTGNTDGLNTKPSYWPNNPNRPVEQVSWQDIQVFLTRLNAQQAGNIPAGWAYVLPTEAQWEYACRAGTTTAYSWGDTITSGNANYLSSGYAQTRDVGLYSANPWGFLDMHGNVVEWTADWHGNYSNGAQTDPEGSTTFSTLVVRGGSWGWSGTESLSAWRGIYHPPTRTNSIGFRVGFRQVQ